MSKEALDHLEELLHQEKWTRVTVATFGVNNLKELDQFVESLDSPELQSQVLEICETHLGEAKSSISALYISGVLAQKRQLLDDANLVKLLNLFQQQNKWQVVELLCLKMLEFGENKLALRSLLDVYRQDGDNSKLTDIQERLIRVDIEEADTVFILAQQAEKSGQTEKCIEYYKKAIHRFILKKNFNRVRDVWLKLMNFVPQEYEYFLQIESKVSKTLGWDRDKSIQLLEDLYPLYIENKNWDHAIDLMVRIFSYDNKHSSLRREVVDCLKQKYKDNEKTLDYIRMSNILDSWKSLPDALEDFKKHMAYEKGNFVFHKTWGVGRIRELKDKEHEFVIDFEKKRNHIMAQKMAVEALTPLPKEDIRVIIATKNRDELKKKIKTDTDWALKTIIRSFDNQADMKSIKALLSPALLTPSEWTSFSSEARELLRKSQDYALVPDTSECYQVRTQPISFEEKTYNLFKAEKDFFKRVEILDELVKEGRTENDYFAEMFNSFVSYLRLNKVNEEVVASFLLVNKLVKLFPFLNPHIQKTFIELYDEIESVESLFSALANTDLRKQFLAFIRTMIENWPQIYARLFSQVSAKATLIEELQNSGQADTVKTLFQQVLERFREDREAFAWLFKHLWDNDLWTVYGIQKDRALFSLINLLEITFRDINNKKDVITNKRVNKLIYGYLFKDGVMQQILKEASEEVLSRVYNLVSGIRDLNANIKADIKAEIVQRFPGFTVQGEDTEIQVANRKGLYASNRMYNAKVKELQHILEIEVPKNSKEIGDAMALGDLKENAEYHAAKERQNILNATVATLNKELESAVVIDKKDVDPTKVGFGTIVVLENKLDGKEESYTILGPWESDPGRNIISYLSPLGDRLLNAKVSERLTFVINERRCDYLVKSIQVAEY